MAQDIEGRGSAVKKPVKGASWGPADHEAEAAGGHGLKEWGQGRPLFGKNGLEPAEGKLGIHRGMEDLKAKTGMGRDHVRRNKGDKGLVGEDAGGVTKLGPDLETEKEGVARRDTEKEGIGGYPGKPNDGKVRRKGADA